MLESLNDYRATFGDTAVSPIMEEEDEYNISNASTKPVPTGDEDAEMVGPVAGGNAAPGSAGEQAASPAPATPGHPAPVADPDRPADGVTVVCIELSPDEPPAGDFEQPPPSAPEFIGTSPDLLPFREYQAFAAAPAPVQPEAPAPVPDRPDALVPLVSEDTVASFNVVEGAGPPHSEASVASPMSTWVLPETEAQGSMAGSHADATTAPARVADTPPLPVAVGRSAWHSPHAQLQSSRCRSCLAQRAERYPRTLRSEP